MKTEVMDNPSADLRETFRWDDATNSWSEPITLKDLVAGNIFYMREPTGDIVADSIGCTVFVATKAPQPSTEDPDRWTINSVPVASQPIKGDA